MWQMANDLLAHLEGNSAGTEFLDHLRRYLAETDGDLETVIEAIDGLCGAGSVLPAFGASIDTGLVESAKLTRAEVEWFVQHTCERIRADNASAMWTGLIRCVGDGVTMTIATTNYDRAIEHACQRAGVVIEDGFAAFGESEWSPWQGFSSAGLRVLKLHGSTDWYLVTGTTKVVKLRHPMALFGGVTLQLSEAGIGALGSALVLPSREKRKNMPPFPSISHELFAAAKVADVVVFVGTSLRDPDVRSIAEDCARRVPTIVVGPDMSFKDGVVPDEARIVREKASRFLVSTLPRMLRLGEFGAPGTVSQSGGNETTMMIEHLTLLADSNATEEQRSRAIEALWREEVSLGAADLEPLISVGRGQVARDALALVALSRDSEHLVAMCDDLARTSDDPDFQTDVKILTEMGALRGSMSTSQTQPAPQDVVGAL
jgi:hypothetical protein